MTATFKEARRIVAAQTIDPGKTVVGIPIDQLPVKRNGLIIKPNVDRLDYAEAGGELSVSAKMEAVLPVALRKNASLLDHQLTGVAWLQQLWSQSPSACRGALLADDMGLGKTLQLLTFIVWCLEHDPAIDPFLIVAPVSLLDNWKEEIDKFFVPGTLSVLTLYGPELREKRLPRDRHSGGAASRWNCPITCSWLAGECKGSAYHV